MWTRLACGFGLNANLYRLRLELGNVWKHAWSTWCDEETFVVLQMPLGMWPRGYGHQFGHVLGSIKVLLVGEHSAGSKFETQRWEIQSVSGVMGMIVTAR